MRDTMITAYTMVRLPFSGYRAVIAVQPSFGRHIVFRQHVVIMTEDRRNIESVRARHAVVAGSTWDGIKVAYLIREVHE